MFETSQDGISPEDIVSMPADEANKIVGRRARSVLKAFATIGRQKLEYLRTDKPEIEVMMVEIKPGGQSGRHMHPVPTLVYVMEGTLTVELDNESRHKCQAGNAVLEVINTWHNARNMGRKSLKLLVIYLGEKGRANLLRGINRLARERA
jgi:quercetin dioxygenase-like cupin family protein